MVRKRLGHAALAVYGVLHRDAVNHGLVARLQSSVEARVKTIVAGSGRYTRHQDHELRGGADVARKEQRKALGVFRRDRLLDLSCLKVQGRGVRQHLDCLDRRAERELDVDPHALQKKISVTESTHFEFRAEFISLTNTPIFNSPTHNVSSLTFGEVLSSQGERNIQFGLKFYFRW